MKSIFVVLLSSALMACSATPHLHGEKEQNIQHRDELLSAALEMLAPTRQRMEYGAVVIQMAGKGPAPQALSEWQSVLSESVSLPVTLNWHEHTGPGYTLTITVDLQNDTCRYQSGKSMSNAACRMVRRQQLAMVKPEHYRNGLPLIVRESILEVGAVERLREGKIRVAEEPGKITEESGGSDGN